MRKKPKTTTDAVAILRNRYIKGDAGRLAAIAAEKAKLSIAGQIYTLRQQRGLTQKELAALVGTTQSVISRLENTDYEQERVETLQKLAAALHCHLDVRLVPDEATSTPPQAGSAAAFEVSEGGYIWSERPLGDECRWVAYGCELQKCG